MKKFYLLTKTLLVAALLMIGANAWAENATVTLDHSAGAQWGSNKGASTVDAEKEHYNNDAGSAWAGCAYAKFSYTVPEGATITSAILTYYVNQGGKSGRNDIIYYMEKDFDLDWANFAGQTGTDLRYTSNRGGTAVAAAATGGTGERGPLAQDVTAAVSAIYAAGQKYIIFQWTGNAGGADLYGKGSDAKAPVLSITYTTETTYTATFTETNSLDPAVTIYSNEGRTSVVPNGTLADKTTYYYKATLTGYKDYDGSFTVSAANPDVHFTMVAKEMYNYTVNAIDEGSNVLYKITEGSVYENDKVTVAYNAFYLKNDGNLLQADRLSTDGKEYHYTFDVDANNKVVTVTYKNTSYSDVVFYKEAEDVATLTETTAGNVPIRCSGAKAAYAESDAVITTLAPGKYKLSSFAWGNAGTDFNVYAGEMLVKTFSTAASTLNIVTSDEFTLATSTDIIVKAAGGAGNSPKVLDFFFIQKLPESVPATITSAGYATFSSEYAVSIPVGVEAYAAKLNGDKVTLTKVDGDVPANTGVILKAKEGVYDLPIVESASAIDTDLKISDGTIEGDQSTIYVLGDGKNGIGFYWLKSGNTLEAGKAYLEIIAESPARGFIGFEGATGINEVNVNKAAAKTGKIYNLNGQIVSKPSKGLFIVDGKVVSF